MGADKDLMSDGCQLEEKRRTVDQVVDLKRAIITSIGIEVTC